jgi:hypothetical protein
MPIVYIWSPDEENKYGHASLQTDKYHISFWPNGSVKRDFGVWETAFDGVEAALFFHQELDRYYEGNRKATAMYQIVNATDEAINRVHEEFLHYNGIEPEEVTLEAAEKITEKKEEPMKTVSKTKYSFVADLVRDKRKTKSKWETFLHGENIPFYHEKQSCVSFCFNTIEMADPNPRVCFVDARPHNSAEMGYDNREADHRVPWFEKEIVKKYWLGGCKRDENCVVS